MAYEDEHFIDSTRMVWNYSFFTDEDVKRFQNGDLYNAYEKFGSHSLSVLNTFGYYFAVWAPNATSVSVIGDFNGWKEHLHPLIVREDSSGIWEGFIPRMHPDTIYKYHIKGFEGIECYKADPYAVYQQLRPGTASITRKISKNWNDGNWMEQQKKYNSLQSPWSVYEVHLASWMRPVKDDENAYTSYLDLIDRLVPYVKQMGFTHVEFMPLMEHPYDGSWGYQDTGFFAATSRFGNPEELMELIDALHQAEVGVILDWVPSHFPNDAHGLYLFDGTHTYEYADMRMGYHPDWNSYIFNYARGEVVSFLISSAHFWFKLFHIDGIRVDAVNSIIRRDFSRAEGEWEPNILGGNENLEAIDFLKKLNNIIYQEFPAVQTIAEEASDWPGITLPISKGGFGFGMKWMMGWMHDIFRYFKKTPEERIQVQNDFTFSMMYFYDEKFMLPFSHDEVVHGKSPMLYKMPGNEWEKFANLRLLYSWMFFHPGAKLLFMGNEFAQTSEWNYKSELDWELLQYEAHNGIQECVRTLNYLYRTETSLSELQFAKKGFEWVDLQHNENGIVVCKRKGKNKDSSLIMVLNLTNIPQRDWKLTLKGKTIESEVFNSDDLKYWGSGDYINNNIKCDIVDKKRKIFEIFIQIPPLGAVIFR